ncbi:MAG: xanthine/uracil permease [Firmicutes bacterium]|nr:xanthine/uracil permease [Bacillota bacterium]MBQ5959475.1 xanthine/uracil permease [Bacillota bacterium]
MEFLKSIGPFVLAVIAVIINGVPQLLYAQTRGFALKPAGFAYLIGAVGNALTGSVTPISGQAETITVASVKKNLRNNVSSILLAALLMVVLGLCGGVSKIADFAGPAVISGMMSGVGLILAGVTWDMFGQEKRTTIVSVVAAIATYAVCIVTKSANSVVWTIFVSVVVSTADFLFLQKRRVDLSTAVEEGRENMESSTEWRFWKKAYWADFKLIKPTFNVAVLLGALSLVMLNIGANISFGGITASIAGTTQNFDHLSIINSLADVPSALFGGPPIEAIISGTAGAPWPVLCGIVFMLVCGILVLTGLVSRLGKYLPAQSISGFLLVIGFALTFAPNLQAVTASENSIAGYMALGVTAWSKNPFLGMVVGVLVRFFGQYVGLV